MISQLPALILTISNTSRYILFSYFPFINFIMFLHIRKGYTYTLYGKYPPHNISAQILDREIAHYELNLTKLSFNILLSIKTKNLHITKYVLH